MKQTTADVLIVGAGISGLMAANLLQKSGKSVIVLDKGKSVGGRLATRRIGPGRADHGAQFFTVRSQEFRNWVSQWQYEKLAFLWSMGWSHGSQSRPTEDGHPRYAIHGGMNALAKHLAQDLDHVYTGVEVMTATAASQEWLLQDHDGELYTSKALILTPPVPQSLATLRAGATRLAQVDYDILSRIEYWPCLCGLFWVDGDIHIPEPGAIQFEDGPISWLADNRHKGISREATILTLHASPEYSTQMWGVPDAQVLEALRSALKPYIESKTKIREAQLKRWMYSLPKKLYDEPCLLAEDLPPLVFAGDAFAQPRVEGAALSGLAAGRTLLEKLKT
jgi:predicted NAD/FAD-dependent oxidoreductase